MEISRWYAMMAANTEMNNQIAAIKKMDSTGFSS
jgi:hypothetical protein